MPFERQKKKKNQTKPHKLSRVQKGLVMFNCRTCILHFIFLQYLRQFKEKGQRTRTDTEESLLLAQEDPVEGHSRGGGGWITTLPAQGLHLKVPKSSYLEAPKSPSYREPEGSDSEWLTHLTNSREAPRHTRIHKWWHYFPVTMATVQNILLWDNGIQETDVLFLKGSWNQG